ncbi:hypothetical protein C8R46DRAFT_1043599, partial [Mycena filopes]
MTTTFKTALDMPIRNSREAPKTFKGKYTEVDTFLRHYNKLLKKCNVVDPQEQSEYIKSEEHYITPDWTLLQEEIRTYYDAEKVDQRYLPADLKTFAKRKARKACHTMGQWKTYYREYMAIAGNMGKNKIPDDKIDAYFWVGIEHHLQQELKTAINTKHPNRDKGIRTNDGSTRKNTPRNGS